jgi:hypothetical protein
MLERELLLALYNVLARCWDKEDPQSVYFESDLAIFEAQGRRALHRILSQHPTAIHCVRDKGKQSHVRCGGISSQIQQWQGVCITPSI